MTGGRNLRLFYNLEINSVCEVVSARGGSTERRKGQRPIKETAPSRFAHSSV